MIAVTVNYWEGQFYAYVFDEDGNNVYTNTYQTNSYKKYTWQTQTGLTSKDTTVFSLGGHQWNTNFNGRLKNVKFFYDQQLDLKSLKCYTDPFCKTCALVATEQKCVACHDGYKLDNGKCVCSTIDNC